jgi:hypothetical protein
MSCFALAERGSGIGCRPNSRATNSARVADISNSVL